MKISLVYVNTLSDIIVFSFQKRFENPCLNLLNIYNKHQPRVRLLWRGDHQHGNIESARVICDVVAQGLYM